jgi:hypothetical protein
MLCLDSKIQWTGRRHRGTLPNDAIDLYHAAAVEFQRSGFVPDDSDDRTKFDGISRLQNQRSIGDCPEKQPETVSRNLRQLIDIPRRDDIICLPAANGPSGSKRCGQLFDNLVGWF